MVPLAQRDLKVLRAPKVQLESMGLTERMEQLVLPVLQASMESMEQRVLQDQRVLRASQDRREPLVRKARLALKV